MARGTLRRTREVQDKKETNDGDKDFGKETSQNLERNRFRVSTALTMLSNALRKVL
jgi:hypothetical protein